MRAEPDPYVVDWAQRAPELAAAAHNDRQWYEAMAGALLRPGDRVAVDVGCGAGGMTLTLAAALGPGGQVVAVDAERVVLDALDRDLAERTASAPPLARVDLVTADLGAGAQPIQETLAKPADLIWASGSMHHVGDQQAGVDALAGLLAAGGRLALAEGGLAQMNLPWDLGVGQPGLEQRLHAANEHWFAEMRRRLPGSVRMPYGWPEALRRAGLAGVTTRSTLLEQGPPLPEPARQHVVERLRHWVERLDAAELVSADDLAAWRRLLDPADPAWLGGRDDLFSLRVRSVHVGVRPPSAR